MNMIEERVVRILAERCQLPAEDVGADTELAALDIDSLTMLEVGFSLQKEFRTEIDDADIAEAMTVGDLIRIVESRPSPV